MSVRPRIALLAVLLATMSACSLDVTETDAYQALEARLTDLEAENESLAVEIAELRGDARYETAVSYECTADEPPGGMASPADSTDGSPRIPFVEVTLQGAPFMERQAPLEEFKWGCGFVVEAESVGDGLFFAPSQYWDEGAVWWDSNDGQERWIELGLGGTFTIDSAIVQADDNDSYLLSYRDLQTGEWVLLWNVPTECCFGMQTRPNSRNNTERHAFDGPVTTDRLRFVAGSGDNLFSVSEIQVFGIPAG